MKTTLQSKKLFVFDMDGTIYLGGKVFPFAVTFINRLRENGYRVLFFTNNASHHPDFYYDKLTSMGFSPKREEILTAGDVTIAFLKRHRTGKPCYLVGTPELTEQFEKEGVSLCEDAPIVVTSFDTTLTYEKLDTACRLIRNGAEYLSTHPDFNCPTEDGFIPDSGAIAAFVTASTGVTPTYFGKPYRTAVEMMCEITGVALSDICIFGDRLYTDIALGRRNGVTAVLVLTGETTREDVEKAEPADRPDFTVSSLEKVDRVLFSKTAGC
ncbi:MAG: HAD-IIA family hydrolase [Ruminococcaceae bacterium]|nr:HAD-IIA family hydrolase [Oscillospiraceae bacterium]